MRAKLVRGSRSSGMCVAEAVGHRVFQVLGADVADAFAVMVSEDFAADLTIQYGFESPVRAGRHWGTRLLRQGVVDVEFKAGFRDRLRNPRALLTIFLMDVVLANPDRVVKGNVLLRRGKGRRALDIIPIDQSECFCNLGTSDGWQSELDGGEYALDL